MIPDRCPSCKEKEAWKEVINPITTGIPLLKHVRIHIGLVKGNHFFKLKYRCRKCGFEQTYPNRDERESDHSVPENSR